MTRNQALRRAVLDKSSQRDYSTQLSVRTQGAFQSLMQRAEAVFDALRSGLSQMVKAEVAAQMPKIPPPQITRIHETPITQVIEKPLERIVERVIEAENKLPLKVKRDEHGHIASVVRGDRVFTIQRGKDGLITGVK
jgi:hypothetical protein